MQRKTNNKNKSKRGRRLPNREVNENRGMVLQVNRSLNFMPSRYRTTLVFDKATIMSNTGLQYTNIRFSPTFCYDVDPIVGSTAMPGFAELGGIYRFYRCNGSRIRVSFANMEPAVAAVAIVCPTNFDPTANTATVVNFLSNRRSKTKPLGPLSGMDASIITDQFKVAEFSGVVYTGQIDNYVGSVSGGSPTNNAWWYVGAYFSGASTTAGVFVNAHIEVDIDFFELNTPST